MRLLFTRRNRIKFPHSLLTHGYFKQRLSLPVYCVIPLALDHKSPAPISALHLPFSRLFPHEKSDAALGS